MLMIRKIVLSLVAILSCGAMAMAQNKQVTGTVTDPEGAPVVGATVLVEGTMNATATSVTGQYSISAPAEANLQFSSVGFTTQTQKVGQRSVIDVVLQHETQMVEDVVVTAFGLPINFYQKDEPGRGRTCNLQIRSLTRFHCATGPSYSFLYSLFYSQPSPPTIMPPPPPKSPHAVPVTAPVTIKIKNL